MAEPHGRRAALVGLAWRESRTARRRLLLYMSSISLGVAALVAIDSFSDNVIRSVHEQSRALLGGDVMAHAQRAADTKRVDSLRDSLARARNAEHDGDELSRRWRSFRAPAARGSCRCTP